MIRWRVDYPLPPVGAWNSVSTNPFGSSWKPTATASAQRGTIRSFAGGLAEVLVAPHLYGSIRAITPPQSELKEKPAGFGSIEVEVSRDGLNVATTIDSRGYLVGNEISPLLAYRRVIWSLIPVRLRNRLDGDKVKWVGVVGVQPHRSSIVCVFRSPLCVKASSQYH